MFLRRKKKYSDPEILEQILNGNSNDVLHFLYENVQPKITSWILKNNGSDEEAQDIFQDAVLAFYEYVRLGKFDQDKSVDGFIFSIGRNKWINRAKQKNKVVSGSEFLNDLNFESEEMEIEIEPIEENTLQNIENLLSKIGERCKELLTHSIFYNMSMQDISEALGFKNADVAKTKNYKCKKRLMKLIQEDGVASEWLFK